MTIEQLRIRRLENSSIDELERLNQKLFGRGHHWASKERIAVCRVLGAKMAEFFRDNGL